MSLEVFPNWLKTPILSKLCMVAHVRNVPNTGDKTKNPNQLI